MQQKGYVQWVGSKPFGQRISWSLRLKNVDQWYNCGGQDPNVSINDHVEFDYTEKDGRGYINMGSFKKLSSSPEVHQGTGSKDLAKSGNVKEDYWNEKSRKDDSKDLRIQWQSARNAAIEVVGILVTNGSLKLPEKNQSDAILGKIADLTDKFYKESASPPTVEPVAEDAEARTGTEG